MIYSYKCKRLPITKEIKRKLRNTFETRGTEGSARGLRPRKKQDLKEKKFK